MTIKINGFEIEENPSNSKPDGDDRLQNYADKLSQADESNTENEEE